MFVEVKVTKKIIHDLKLKFVVSYTTRAKREKETEGVEHYFITPEVAKEKMHTEQILAYTKIGKIEYFATLETLNDSNLYIIDPAGIKYLKNNFQKLNIKVIYVMTDSDLRIERAKLRDNEDFAKSFEKRNTAEDEQFTEFENERSYNYIIYNNSDQKYAVNCLIDYVIQTTKDALESDNDLPLYCIVGRTGSGKDSICKHAIEYFENTKSKFTVGS